MDEKIYTPEVIVENPFPGEPVLIDSSSKPSSDGNYSPTVTRPRAFKKKVLANELLSTALNTRSRKILGEFSFAASGALQLGDFREGISGDLRLTPNGITARDLAGLTTFALDGTDGSAVFKGHVQAGSFVSGSDNGVTVGPEIGVNGSDFTDIQEAIDFINDLGGGTVFINEGRYEVTTSITMYSNIKLIGQEDESTIIDFNGSNAKIEIGEIGTTPLTNSNIEFKNLQFTGRRATSTSKLEGVITASVSGLYIRECKFTDNWNSSLGAGVDIVTDGQRGVIQGCIFSSSGINIANKMDRLLISGNLFSNSASYGIWFTSGQLDIIENNVFDNLTGSAIITDTGGDDITVVTVHSNFFNLQKGTAIYIGDGIEASGWTISNNYLSGVASPNSGDGIFLGASTRENIIIGNSIAAFKDGDGIDNNAGDRNIIIGNNISFCSGYGISLDGSTLNNLVSNNIFNSNTSGGIQDLGTNTVANNLTI